MNLICILRVFVFVLYGVVGWSEGVGMEGCLRKNCRRWWEGGGGGGTKVGSLYTKGVSGCYFD